VDPLLYAVSGQGWSIFYGVDTASPPESTWHALQRHKSTFDVVILDHTYGPEEVESDHLSARQVVAHMNRMREEDLLKNQARIFATHTAHEGNPPHPELADFAAHHGYEVAYDGLRV
jgi:phosphoribosyl 1,2-cyclic phosphate phosphodiesterase